MVRETIHSVDPNVNFQEVVASRGKPWTARWGHEEPIIQRIAGGGPFGQGGPEYENDPVPPCQHVMSDVPYSHWSA